jgi:hypothetical protein
MEPSELMDSRAIEKVRRRAGKKKRGGAGRDRERGEPCLRPNKSNSNQNEVGR